MRSILNMFLNEAKKDPASIKDAEDKDDADLNEDEAENDGDVEEKQDKQQDDDNEEDSADSEDNDTGDGDELFTDVDNEIEQNDDTDINNENDLDNNDGNNDNNEEDTNDVDSDNNIGDSEDMDNEDSDDDQDLKIKTKKLLTDFVNLHNEVKNMYNDLTNYSTENKVQFLTISRMAGNLEELAYSINDYIHIRFANRSYEENLLMYQKIIDSIKISDEIISKIIENRNNH